MIAKNIKLRFGSKTVTLADENSEATVNGVRIWIKREPDKITPIATIPDGSRYKKPPEIVSFEWYWGDEK